MDSLVTQKLLSPLLASVLAVHTGLKWSPGGNKSIQRPTNKTSKHALAGENASAKQPDLLPIHSAEHFLVDSAMKMFDVAHL